MAVPTIEVSTYRPTTRTEEANEIIQKSRDLWSLHGWVHAKLNYFTVMISNGLCNDKALIYAWVSDPTNTPNWEKMATVCGMESADHAKEYFLDLLEGFSQVYADEINGRPNKIRKLMNSIGN